MASISRDEEIKMIHIAYADFYRIGAGLFAIIILAIIGSWLFGQNALGLADTMLGYVTNVATEALSVIATIVVIDQLNRRRETQERKLALFRQAKSRSNDFALDALRQIQDNGWWDDLLKHYPSEREEYRIDLSQVQWAGGVQLREVDLGEANLSRANLEGANLGSANLQQAKLWRANLQQADLWEANLQEAVLLVTNLQEAYLGSANLQQAKLWRANLQQADLWEANLQEAVLLVTNLQEAYLGSANLQQANLKHSNLQQANLWRTNLQGANLWEANLQQAELGLANLQGTDLWEANLQGANLWEANLRGANLHDAQFDEKTVLPDAQALKDEDGDYLRNEDGNFIYDKYWTPETDMSRYTDPEHPDFWEPDWVKEQREKGES